jgi:chromosome segregation ATPase
VKENQKEFRNSLEEEYRRKLSKEKENIESTLESLRQEITRLREHRMQLESQLQQHAHYKSEKDSGYSTTHAHSTESILNNKEIFTRIENEYQNQLQKEKAYFENKIRELEKDYESLTEEMSHLKTKCRQDRLLMKTEFEKERRDIEDRFEREKRDLQTSMQMRMQGLRDPMVSSL